MIEQTQVAEAIAQPELPSSAQHYVGLHPRLLIGGEALNAAKKDLPTVASEQLGTFSQRDYSPFSAASTKERNSYWNQRNENTDEEKHQAWVKGLVAAFEDGKTHFANTDKGKGWREFYAKLGIDTQNFTTQTAEGLHSKYLQNQPDKLGIKQFVADVLSANIQDGLEANLGAVSWLSKIFGNLSSEAITQIVMAEARLTTNPDELINQANKKEAVDTPSRVNDLNSDEQRILNFIWDAQIETTLAAEETPATTQQTAETVPQPATKAATEAEAPQATQVPEVNLQLGRHALQEIRDLGLAVNTDTDLSQLTQELRNKGWNVDLKETQEYIETAINAAEIDTPRKIEFEPAEGNTRYLTAETKSGNDTKTIYLDTSLRGQLNVKPGETITLVLNGEKQVVTIARPRVRDDGTIEGPKTNTLRVSADVLTSLGLPKAFAVIPHFNAATKEVDLNQPETTDSPIVKVRKPREVTYVQGTMGNVTFLSVDDLNRFGLKDGETITLHFGGVIREITVNQRDQGEESWRFSETLGKELSIPGGLTVRSAFDKNTRTLSFGPGVAVYGNEIGQGNYDIPEGIEELSKRAKEYGGYVVVLDPNKQDTADIEAGFVQGLVYVDGRCYTARIPRPDALYKDSGISLNGNGSQLTNSFEHELAANETGAVIDNKLYFDKILLDYGLADYRPESLSLNAKSEEVTAFFDRHTDMIIKPQWGNSGRGIFRVTKQPGGFVISERKFDRATNRHSTKQTSVGSVAELLTTIPTLDSMNGTGVGLDKMFVQERINLMEYQYNDPSTGEWITGNVEPRILVQRGVDGRIKIGAMVARIQNNNSEIPHKFDLLWVLNNIYQGDQDKEGKVQTTIKDLQTAAATLLQGAEQQSGGRPLGELTVDFGFTADKKWKMIEANPQGANFSIYSDVAHGSPNSDALQQRMGGAMEYSLHLTGMN